jgi:hypothetical protein
VKRVDVVTTVQQAVGNSNGQHGIVGECAVRCEQLKVHRLRTTMFVDRADHVSGNGAEHLQ